MNLLQPSTLRNAQNPLNPWLGLCHPTASDFLPPCCPG